MKNTIIGAVIGAVINAAITTNPTIPLFGIPIPTVQLCLTLLFVCGACLFTYRKLVKKFAADVKQELRDDDNDDLSA